jgi:5,10-methylene-tetrahydrofolate dehydrogenase/methenyl tetrahydrofolate cyclohydrolase
MSLLESLPIDYTGLDATVIGRSNLVGRPIALELLHSSLVAMLVFLFSLEQV